VTRESTGLYLVPAHIVAAGLLDVHIGHFVKLAVLSGRRAVA